MGVGKITDLCIYFASGAFLIAMSILKKGKFGKKAAVVTFAGIALIALGIFTIYH